MQTSRIWSDEGAKYIQHVSSSPATRLDVVNLQARMSKRHSYCYLTPDSQNLSSSFLTLDVHCLHAMLFRRSWTRNCNGDKLVRQEFVPSEKSSMPRFNSTY